MQSKRGADKTAIIYRRDKQREREGEPRETRQKTNAMRHETRYVVCGMWHEAREKSGKLVTPPHRYMVFMGKLYIGKGKANTLHVANEMDSKCVCDTRLAIKRREHATKFMRNFNETQTDEVAHTHTQRNTNKHTHTHMHRSILANERAARCITPP